MYSSVYKGNGWFDLLFAALPLMCVSSGCLQNRLSTWEFAGFDLVSLMCLLSGCLRNRASASGMTGFDAHPYLHLRTHVRTHSHCLALELVNRVSTSGLAGFVTCREVCRVSGFVNRLLGVGLEVAQCSSKRAQSASTLGFSHRIMCILATNDALMRLLNPPCAGHAAF